MPSDVSTDWKAAHERMMEEFPPRSITPMRQELEPPPKRRSRGGLQTEITAALVQEIRNLYAQDVRKIEIAAALRISPSTVTKYTKLRRRGWA